MAKKNVVEDRLTRVDILKFFPKKSLLPILEGMVFRADGGLEANTLMNYMRVRGGHKSNMDVVLSRRILDTMVKTKDWPLEIHVTVDVREQEYKGEKVQVEFYSAEIKTEKGREINYDCSDVYGIGDYPFPEIEYVGKQVVKKEIKWLPEIILDGLVCQDMITASNFANDDPTKTSLHQLCIKKGKVYATCGVVLYVKQLVDSQGREMRFDLSLPFPMLTYLKPWTSTAFISEDGVFVKIEFLDGSFILGRAPSSTFPNTAAIDQMFHPEMESKLTWTAHIKYWNEMLETLTPFAKQVKGFTKVAMLLHSSGKVELMHAPNGPKVNELVYEPVPSIDYTLPCNADGDMRVTVMLDRDKLKKHIKTSDPRATLNLTHFGKKSMPHPQPDRLYPLLVEVGDGSQRLIMPMMDSDEVCTH